MGATSNEYRVRVSEESTFQVRRQCEPSVVKVLMLKGEKGDPGGGGAGKYADLPDKPSINGATLVDDVTLAELGIQIISEPEIDNLLSHDE